MNLDSGILTNLLTKFAAAFSGGFSRIYPDAMDLLAILALLEITVAAVWWAIAEDNAIVSFLRKCIQIGFFIFIVTQYQMLIDVVLNGFLDTGLKAGGGGSRALIKDPSQIIDYGFTATAPIFKHIEDYGPVDSLANLPDIIMTGLSGILVLLAYFAIGIQVFITYLEFYLVSVLGLILVPFGVFKHTSFIAEKVFGGILAFGIRLMVLAFILTVAAPTLADVAAAMPAAPTFPEVMVMFLAALTIMGLSWHAPGIASGLISGSPSLTAGAAIGMGAAAAGGIAGAGLAASAAAKGAAKSGVSATRAAASTAGAVITAAQLGASDGGGPVGAVRGVAGFARYSARSASSKATSGIREAYEGGKMTAFRSSSQTENAASGPGAGNRNAAGSFSMPGWAQKIQQAKAAIPAEAHPGPGIHVPIRHE